MIFFSGMPAIAALVPAVIGAVICFWGYRLFKLVLGIVGFVLGGFLAGTLALGLSGGSTIIALVAAIVGAIVGAVLLTAFYYLGVFVLGAAAGWMLGSIVAGATGSAATLLVAVVLAVICGVLALVVQRIVIVVATACLGSWGVVAGLFHLSTGTIFSPTVFWIPTSGFRRSGGGFLLLILLWLVLTVVGVVFQLRFGRSGRSVRPGER